MRLNQSVALVSHQTAADPKFKDLTYDGEDYQMATGVLFGTGWGMAHVAATYAPTALIITSASSRTSRAAAFAAKHDKLPLEVIGLTSASNASYTLIHQSHLAPYHGRTSL